MTVWAMEYNECYHESGYVALSLHKTKEGAEVAMNKHKQTRNNPEDWELWRVEAVEVED